MEGARTDSEDCGERQAASSRRRAAAGGEQQAAAAGGRRQAAGGVQRAGHEGTDDAADRRAEISMDTYRVLAALVRGDEAEALVREELDLAYNRDDETTNDRRRGRVA